MTTDGGSSADSDAPFEAGAPDAADAGRRVPIQLSAGTDYACALFSDATVSCWGDPGDGRLGGPYADPTPVPGAVADQQVAAGGFAECLLSKAGAVSCLGDDWYGAVGDGHSGEGDIVTTPTLIMPLGVTYVSMGDSFGCALAMNGAVSCWGYNAAGEIGPGGGSTGLGQVHPTPTLVSDLPQAGMIATGLSHACALSLDRQTVSCWGEGYYGQLGDGMSGSGYVRATPAPVVGLPAGVSTIAAGGGDSCAITDGGALWCWGANDQAQLRTGAPGSPVANPTQIPGLESIAQTSPGSNDEICAVTTSGATYCWGLDNVGASEPDAALNYFAPTLVTGVPAAKQVATGNDFGCVLGVDSTVWCWGANYEGQCGPLASGMVVPTPVQVPF